MAETTYTQARANFRAICDRVAQTGETMVIHRRGAEDVAIVSAAELRSLEETAHLLRSPKNARRLLKGIALARSGRGKPTTVAELRREIGFEKAK